MASAELSTLLSSLGLGQHIGAIADLGAENVEDLEDATDAELISLGMPPDGVAKLRAAIANPTGASVEAPTVVIAQPLVAEVPVLQPVAVQPVSPTSSAHRMRRSKELATLGTERRGGELTRWWCAGAAAADGDHDLQAGRGARGAAGRAGPGIAAAPRRHRDGRHSVRVLR